MTWTTTPLGYILGDVLGLSARVDYTRAWTIYSHEGNEVKVLAEGQGASLDYAKRDAEEAYRRFAI